MSFTQEQIAKAAKCGSAQELFDLAKAEGVEMTKEEAEKYYAQLSSGEMNASDMDKVAGGLCVGNVCDQC